MAKANTYDELLHKAAAYCSASEHCISEVKEKLTKWSENQEHTDKIIERLISEGFINEKRFCEAYTKDKFRFNKWGKVKISYALKHKGLSANDISNALDIIDENDYEELLSELLKAKLKTMKWKSDYEKQGKLFGYAQGKGFESNVISKVIKSL